MNRKISVILASALFCLCFSTSEQYSSSVILTQIDKSRTKDKAEVKEVLRKVSDWQLSHYKEKGYTKWPVIEWVYSTYYTGLFKVAQLLDEKQYFKDILQYAQQAEWQVGKGKRRFFADDYLIGDLYCKLFSKYDDPKMIADFRRMADELIAVKSTESLELNYKTMNVFRVWAWCDAMFMGPPSLFSLANVTKENKYRDLADSLFWQTYDYLYDKNEHLYYRDSRYFNKIEKNGEKKFWSRGNGWVLAGLARILEEMPENYASRNRYETLFKEMAEKIASLQQPDGMWRSSLLDPETYPGKETSGTGFHCYGLAWGINHGLLDKKIYKPIALKAWKSLNECVQPNGKLGYVQKIGEEPERATYDDTYDYGVGAFMLAGTEIIKLI